MPHPDVAPQYVRPVDAQGGPEVDTGGLVWSNRGTSDNFGVFGSQADAARQVVDAAFFFWQQVIGSFNQDGGNDQLDVTVTATARGTGQGGGGGVATLIGSKPRTGTITIGGGSDDDGNGTVDDAEGYYVDPTPYDFSEFQGDIVNAFTGNATPGHAAANDNDLFSLVTAELQHAMGITSTGGSTIAWRTDVNDYLRLTTSDDVTDTPGDLWVVKSPRVRALMTSNNGGAGGASRDVAVHSAKPTNSVFFEGETYTGVIDTGGASYGDGVRNLPSYTAVMTMGDIYGYIVNPPQDVGQTFYAIPDRANRQVLVRNTAFQSNDLMEMRSANSGIFITLNIGNDVPGTNMDGLFVVQFSRLAFDSVIMDGGSGSDILRVDGNDGAPVTLRGGNSADTFDVSLIQRNLDLITGTVVVEGGTNSDTMLIYDTNDTTGDNTNFTNNSFDTTGFNFLTYSAVESITYTAGTGNDIINVDSLSTPTTIHGNSGADTITLGTGAFDANTISAAMHVTGGIGADRLNIGSGNSDALAANITWDGSGGGDSLVYNDTSPTYSINYDISPTGVNRDGLNQPFLVSYLNTQSITINGSAGADTVYVRNAVAPSIFAFGNNGNDNFVRGDGLVTATSGAVFNGGNGIDRITFDDHLRPGNLIWDLRNNEVIYGGLILFETTNFESVGILAGNGNDEITFKGTQGASLFQSFNVDAGGGSDTILIGFQNTAARFFAPATINGGAGNDNYTWQFASDNWYDGLGGVFTYPVMLDGGSGFNTLNHDETLRTAASVDFYHDRIFTREPQPFAFGADFNYDNLNAITVTASNSANSVAVHGVSSDIDTGNQVTLNMNGGNDLATVFPQDAAGNLTINGNIGILGGAQTDLMRVQDAGSSNAINYAFSNPFGAGTQNLFGMGTRGLGTATIETWEVYGGTGNDTFAMNQFSSGIALGIDAGGGDDTLQFGNNGLGAITSLASFNFSGGAGYDVFNLNNQTHTGTWTYTRNGGSILASSTLGASYFLSDFLTELMRFNGGPSAETFNINVVAAGSAVEANGGAAQDILRLAPAASNLEPIQGMVTFNAELGGGNVFVFDNLDTTGDTLHLDQVSLGAFPGDTLFGPGGSLSFAGLTDNGSTPALMVNLGSGSDTVFGQPLASGTATINLNGQNFSDGPEGVGDSLNLALAAAANYVITGTNSGNVVSDTTGRLNWNGVEFPLVIDDVAPNALTADFHFDVPAQRVDFSFSEDVSPTFSLAYFYLTNVDTMIDVPTSMMAFAYDVGSNTASVTFPGFESGALPDGNYHINLVPGYADVFGNASTAAIEGDFFNFAGDANHDRAIDISDFAILAGRFNQPGTFSQGDFNYNGSTEIGDFAILASRFNQTLDPPAAARASMAVSSRLSVFSRTGMEENDLALVV